MPVLKHAKKKLRQDKKRTVQRKKVKNLFKDLVKKAKTNPSGESVNAAVKAIDKAAKNHVIHKNKAARLKSKLSKLGTSVAVKKQEATAKKTEKKPKNTKTASKKTPAKKTA